MALVLSLGSGMMHLTIQNQEMQQIHEKSQIGQIVVEEIPVKVEQQMNDLLRETEVYVASFLIDLLPYELIISEDETDKKQIMQLAQALAYSLITEQYNEMKNNAPTFSFLQSQKGRVAYNNIYDEHLVNVVTEIAFEKTKRVEDVVLKKEMSRLSNYTTVYNTLLKIIIGIKKGEMLSQHSAALNTIEMELNRAHLVIKTTVDKTDKMNKQYSRHITYTPMKIIVYTPIKWEQYIYGGTIDSGFLEVKNVFIKHERKP
ncbi:MAG: hypothetical protein ACRCSG_08235 [Cellulosilyticaceae bacterium]